MKKFINWHKLTIGKLQNILRIDSYQTLWISFVKGLFIGYLLCMLTSCALTYEAPHKCELMLRGEPCLTSHVCCNPPQTYHYETYPNYYNWWWLTRPKHTTNYVIVKPNNKPTYNGHRPNLNNKPNNKPNKNRSKRK